ncbi:hypothetical protein V9T40_006355 [Parthenolecanium corni]|uniref:Uncharacterized protein n=1 Tax=Parthenolecanium corni TaxID=536013 RepID=A0AAN9TJW8_9HEMI
MKRTREPFRIPTETATHSIRKYSGKTDPRTPLQFIREFEHSALFTVTVTELDLRGKEIETKNTQMRNQRHFMASLDESFSVYSAAFLYFQTRCGMCEVYNYMREYFLELTWTKADRLEEYKAILMEKFDPNGQESWQDYLIQTFIRLRDCEPIYDTFKIDEEHFREVMNQKISEVGKTDLPGCDFTAFVEKVHTSNFREKIYNVKTLNMKWFAKVIYAYSKSEYKEQSKLQKEKVPVEEKHFSDPQTQTENLSSHQPEVTQTAISPADPDNSQRNKQEKLSCAGCRAQNSYLTRLRPFLFSIFYFILYYLISQFWDLESNCDTVLENYKKKLTISQSR